MSNSWRPDVLSGEVYERECRTVTDERPKRDGTACYRIVQACLENHASSVQDVPRLQELLYYFPKKSF
jgi:hypothetical protein